MNRPDLNERIRTGGWFYTGDLGWLDADDQLYYLERMDSIIRHKGNLIHPAEVEEILDRHPAVNIAAVIGLPSEIGDFDIAAVVQLHPGRVATAIELETHCRDCSPNWMLPSVIRLVESIALTGTGKPIYSELKRLLVKNDTPVS